MKELKKSALGRGVSLLLILLFANIVAVFSQGTNTVSPPPTKMIGPAPTAAALGKYGDIPVSYFNGSANISIPLYDIKTSQHSLAIKLQYQSNGYKPTEDASWVGLGWSLFAGGVITRTVRGNDDLAVGRGFPYKSSVSDMPKNDGNNNWDPLISLNEDREAMYDMLYTKNNDGEPDIFTYNFAGNTGKFVIGNTDEPGNAENGPYTGNFSNRIYQAERSGLLIEYINPGSYWVITDEKGYRYTFNEIEMTMDYTASLENVNLDTYTLPPGVLVGQPVTSVISSWYLTSIRSPLGEEVTFEYEGDAGGYYSTAVSPLFRSEEVYDLRSGEGINIIDCQVGQSGQQSRYEVLSVKSSNLL